MMMISSAVSAHRRSGLCRTILAPPGEYCRQLAHIEELALKTVHNPALHITSSECNPTQLTFGRIVTQADTAILKEAREDIDALEHVVKSLGNFVVARQLGPLPLHPLDELIHQRCDIFAAGSHSRFGR